MILSDNKTNTEILYLYVKKFKWLNPINHEGFGGHPKEGRVYRAVKNTDTNSYRLIYGKIGNIGQGIMFQSLEDDSDGYTADMVPITKSNILDFNIEEEDLDLLAVWVETNDEDIRQIFEPPLLPPPRPSFSTPLPSSSSPEIEALTEFTECVLELRDIDVFSFDTVHDLIHKLTEPPNESIEVLNIRMNEAFGGGANMVKVFELLARYVGDDRRTNKDPQDLLEAMKFLTYEVNRVKLTRTPQ